MKMITLDDLLLEELQDIYSAENQMIKALPKLAEAADSGHLHRVFEEHLEQTHRHVQRIEQICEQLDVKPKGKKCMGMEGLVAEAVAVLDTDTEPDVLDAALIGIAQRMAHYQIAAYGTICAHARQLGFMNMADLLHQTLEDNKEIDQRLTELAENRVNVEAAMREGNPAV